jgi:CRISPR-associated protein Cmr4
MATHLIFVHARSPLHAGTGQATAAVDLPIARDRATGYPLLPGSSIKGTLRAAARAGKDTLPREHWPAFGPETANASDNAGDLAFTDARLLLLPVRSVAGTFAWATSPYLLACFFRDARLANQADVPRVPDVPSDVAQITQNSSLGLRVRDADKVVLEEFDLNAGRTLNALADWLARRVFPGDPDWQEMLKKRLCVVHDDRMSFLAQHGTEITTRVSIDPTTGTARDGQLWTEEHLPAETVLTGVIEDTSAGDLHTKLLQRLTQSPLQFGGKASVGRGRCKLELHPQPARK